MVRLSSPGAREFGPIRADRTLEIPSAAVKTEVKAIRLSSLDAFRGAVILLMLLVNNAAVDTATPQQLMHAGWNQGIHFADLVFPWFIFIVGVSLSLSVGSFLEKGKSRFRFIGKAFVRSVCLIGLGMFLQCAMDKHLELSMGILQSIGCAYFVAAVVCTGPKWMRPVFGCMLLGGYAWAIMNVSFPGGPAGVFEENRNLMHYLDSKYLIRYGLDGLITTLPLAGLALFGSMIGDVLGNRVTPGIIKFTIVALSGGCFLLAGNALNAYIPFNKPVATPSYLMVAGGTGAMALAVFYLIADLLPLRWLAAPLAVWGSNAIGAYVFPIALKVLVLQQWITTVGGTKMSLQSAAIHLCKQRYGPIEGGWVYTAAYIGAWWFVLAILYKKRLFLKI